MRLHEDKQKNIDMHKDILKNLRKKNNSIDSIYKGKFDNEIKAIERKIEDLTLHDNIDKWKIRINNTSVIK